MLRARVRTVVDATQAPSVHMRIDLRRRERAVAEQLLDRPQVGAALQQVRREGVPQQMRVHAAGVETCLLGELSQTQGRIRCRAIDHSNSSLISQ